MKSYVDVFDDWDRDVQQVYLRELEDELDRCREIYAKPKIVNAEAHVVVRFGLAEAAN